MKIGFIVDSLVLSDKSYWLINAINQNSLFDDICIFSKNISTKPLNPNCAIYDIVHAWNFSDGALVATDIASAKTLSKISTNADKYYYIWDLEWMGGVYNYIGVLDTLLDPKLKLITSSDNYNHILKNISGKKVDKCIKDFNLEEFYEFCRTE